MNATTIIIDANWCSIFAEVCSRFQCRSMEKLPLSSKYPMYEIGIRTQHCVASKGGWWLGEIVSIPFDYEGRIRHAADSVIRQIMRRLFANEVESIDIKYMPRDCKSQQNTRRQCLLLFDGVNKHVFVFVLGIDNTESAKNITDIEMDYISMQPNREENIYVSMNDIGRKKVSFDDSTISSYSKEQQKVAEQKNIKRRKYNLLVKMFQKFGLPSKVDDNYTADRQFVRSASFRSTPSSTFYTSKSISRSTPYLVIDPKVSEAKPFPIDTRDMAFQPYSIVLFMELIRRGIVFDALNANFHTIIPYDRERETVTQALIRLVESAVWIVIRKNNKENGVYAYRTGSRLIYQWKDLQHLLPKNAMRVQAAIDNVYVSIIDIYSERQHYSTTGNESNCYRSASWIQLCNFDLIFERIKASVNFVKSYEKLNLPSIDEDTNVKRRRSTITNGSLNVNTDYKIRRRVILSSQCSTVSPTDYVQI